jgi:hypothetical protein
MEDSLAREGLDIEKLNDAFLSAPGPLMALGNETCGKDFWSRPRIADSLSDYPERTPPRLH